MRFDDDKSSDKDDAYVTDNPIKTSAKEQEEMAKEAIKKFKMLESDNECNDNTNDNSDETQCS